MAAAAIVAESLCRLGLSVNFGVTCARTLERRKCRQWRHKARRDVELPMPRSAARQVEKQPYGWKRTQLRKTHNLPRFATRVTLKTPPLGSPSRYEAARPHSASSRFSLAGKREASRSGGCSPGAGARTPPRKRLGHRVFRNARPTTACRTLLRVPFSPRVPFARGVASRFGRRIATRGRNRACRRARRFWRKSPLARREI